jgi:hypothetical protein
MRVANILTSTSIKKRFNRISGYSFSLSRPILLLLTGIVVGAIVGLDPYLATFVSEEIWSLILLYDFPYKVSLATAVFLCTTGVLIAWAARAREYREILIVAILISMQLVALGSGGLDPSDLVVAAYMALIIAYALANPTNPIQFPLVMYFALAIGILNLPYVLIDKPVHFMIGLIKYSKSAILPLIIVHILTSDRLVRVFVKTLVAVAFISACIGILQVIIFAYSGITMVIVPDMNEAIKPTPWGMALRAHGLNSEPHTLLTFLLIALPFSIYSITKASSTRHTIFSGAVAVTIIMGIFLTWSYGGIIGVFIIVGLFPFFVWPNRSIHYLLALLMIPVFLYATDLISVIYKMVQNEATMSTGIWQRKQLALITLDELSRNPWIGRGFETVQYFSGNYMPRTVHNAYLEAWAATGPMGFIVFTAMMLIFTTSTFILGFSGSGEREYRLRLVTLALISFMILMISEPALYSASTWLLLGFAQALILLYGRKSDNSRSIDSTLEIVGRAHRQRRRKHK